MTLLNKTTLIDEITEVATNNATTKNFRLKITKDFRSIKNFFTTINIVDI